MDALQQAQPRIEKWGPFTVVGAGVDCGNDPAPIFALWGGFFEKYSAPETHNGVVGVCRDTAPDSFHYMAAYLVPHGTKPPEGLTARTFPGTKFAVWPFKGTPPEMGAAFRDIYANRLAAAGLKAHPSGLCVELYPPNPMDEAAGTLSADLYVSVE
jgi:predicted transcriptional regulator YdeE